MSVAFASARPRGKGEVTQQTIQKVKEHAFIQTILDIYSVHAPAAGGWFLGRSGKLVNLRGLQRWTAGERGGGRRRRRRRRWNKAKVFRSLQREREKDVGNKIGMARYPRCSPRGNAAKHTLGNGNKICKYAINLWWFVSFWPLKNPT